MAMQPRKLMLALDQVLNTLHPTAAIGEPLRRVRNALMDHAKMRTEGLMLMHYECSKCKQRERIWNSTTFTVPFCIICSYCGAGDMCHVDWEKDSFEPGYMPQPGERFFIIGSSTHRLGSYIAYGKTIGMSKDSFLQGTSELQTTLIRMPLNNKYIPCTACENVANLAESRQTVTCELNSEGLNRPIVCQDYAQDFFVHCDNSVRCDHCTYHEKQPDGTITCLYNLHPSDIGLVKSSTANIWYAAYCDRYQFGDSLTTHYKELQYVKK